MGFEPILSESQPEVLTANTNVTPKLSILVRVEGLEPSIPRGRQILSL